jgi:inorganic pyrophosphatase/exopolyphosphatase
MSTIQEDLEHAKSNIGGSSDKSQSLGEIVDAIKHILSSDDIKQKSRKTASMVFASTKIRAKNEIYMAKLGIKNDVAKAMVDELEEEVISLKGEGRKELIEITRNLDNKVEEEHKLLGNKVLTIR